MADEKELNLDEDAENQEEGKSKKKLIIIIAAIVLLLVIVGAVAFFLLSGDDNSADEASQSNANGETASETEKEEKPKHALYLPLDPAFVVSFQTGKRARFLQLRIEFMTYEEKVIQELKENMPMIRNEIVMLVSRQDFAELRTLSGREKLQKLLHESLNEVLEKHMGSKGIEAVLFTDYVMQ